MSEKLERFVNLMKEIFELDKSDLDFGIYRIMNLRKAKIEDFLENGLPQKVQETLAPFAQGDKSKIEARIAEIESQLGDVSALPETIPMVKEYNDLKKQLASGTDLSALETDVYSALYSFFNRYYDEGDFISKRRYKEGVCAIPYEGEEVKLYWANQDQYYIKTSENFKDYAFVASNQYGDTLNVHFELVDATTEQNNNKESKDTKRTFMLFTENEENYPGVKTFEYREETNELIIRFVFDIPEDKKKKYDVENYNAIYEWITQTHNEKLFSILLMTDGKKDSVNLMQKHLKAYVAKNTFDYFIHKDLRGFLTRELDFYIKTEIMHLDDLDTENEKQAETYIAKIRAVKRVGKIIIDFLAQIEDFQKKLWLKKKFVVETNWCMTLDNVDESFWDEIIANKAQIDEWKKTTTIEKRKGYSENLSADFIINNPDLCIDTKNFETGFKERLVASKDYSSNPLVGELFRGDNYHAIRLINNKYAHKVKMIFIDPPFNLPQNGDFLYRTNYKDSSWLAMLHCRLVEAKEMLRDDGCIFVRCDYHGNSIVRLLLDTVFGESNYKNEIVINRFQKAAEGLTNTTESLFVYSNSDSFKFNDVQKPRACVFCNTPIEPQWQWSHSAGAGTLPRYFTVNGERVLLYPPKSRHWTNKQEVIDKLEKEGRIRINFNTKYTDCNGNKTPYIPEKLQATTVSIDNNWTDIPGYEFGVFSKEKFSTQNALELLERCVLASTDEGDIVFDYFMGSATTQIAALKNKRKWIGVEMGEYFYDIPLTRIKKEMESGVFKYSVIENYEDALSNIEMQSNDGAMSLFGDEYLINYMIDLESKGSLLNLDAFKEPFRYEMKITEKNETKKRPVDVVETFNYLIGLTVVRQSAVSYFNAVSASAPAYEGAVDLVKDNSGEYGFKQIEGNLPDGRRALVIWRTVSGDILKTNAALDAYFLKHRINPLDREFDVIFVNGDNNLENLRTDKETWKVQMTETEFKKRMFEEE